MAASPSGTTPGTLSPPNGADLSVKYAKLASEYAKIRAQFGVVKKAVLSEQAKNTDLAESLREKELLERKRESEMEAVEFRNQQLTRRIQV